MVYYIHIIHNLKNLLHFVGRSWFACLVSSWKLLCKSNKCKTRIIVSYRLIKISRLGRVHSCVSLLNITEISNCYVEYNIVNVMLCVTCCCPILTNYGMTWRILVKLSNTKCYKNLSDGFQIATCEAVCRCEIYHHTLQHFVTKVSKCDQMLSVAHVCGKCISITLIYIMLFFFFATNTSM